MEVVVEMRMVGDVVEEEIMIKEIELEVLKMEVEMVI